MTYERTLTKGRVYREGVQQLTVHVRLYTYRGEKAKKVYE